MPRSLILGNGSMLATFDARMQMRDVYFPFVGLEDHTTFGNVHRVGVMVEDRGFAWFDDPAWTIQPGYKIDTLVGESTLRHDGLGLVITIEDSVHPVHNVLLRRFFIKTTDGAERRVRVFLHHDFHIYGDTQKDTAFYEPYTNSVIHYRQTRYFLVGGQTDRPQVCRTAQHGGVYDSVLHSTKQIPSCGISSFTTGKANFRGLLGTWKDAEDGVLSENPIEQGSVDSTVGIHCIADGNGTEVTGWLCLGKTLDDVVALQRTILEETPERLSRNCGNYWKSWANKMQQTRGSLAPELTDLYRRSLLLIRLHADNGGGIVAAADSDIMAFNRDTYTYVWPRDGAFISMAMDHAGYGEVSRRFFEFCTRVQLPDGYLLHKYNPDGSPGSSWHPWFRNGEAQLPIQEDETALVVHALLKHFEINQDFEFLQKMYENFVRKAAQFLHDFREPGTGLPMASYDPWEEHRGIFTYTTACVIAGLHAAAQIAHILGHAKHSERYQVAADEMRQALLFHLYDDGAGRFVKKIKRKNGKTTERDLTPDMSVAAVWLLGVLPPDDPRIVTTMKQLREMLTIRTPVGGIARYTSDTYQRAAGTDGVATGNPWIITTLWDAQWTIATAKTVDDLKPAAQVLAWVHAHAGPTGVLPEQLHPLTGAHLSVSPLAWSHAAYVETYLKYLEKEKELR